VTAIVGGLRARLIHDSIFNYVKDGLTVLGWTGNPAPRRYVPINFIAQTPNLEAEVPLNTLALSDENVTDQSAEIGSQFAEHTRNFYLDFFAESDAIGKHLIGDLRDLLEGRMPSLGYLGPEIPVFDYTQATPSQIFYVELTSLRVDRAHNWAQRWLQHWYSISFSVVDWYAGDEDEVQGFQG
jgi:hypothetical protein